MSSRMTLSKNEFTCSLPKIFSPTSLVFSSENAKKILGRNFLSPSQFMRPFGDMNGIPLKFSYGEKYQDTISDFKLDFYDSEDYKKKELYQINNYIINCLGSEAIMPTFEKNFKRLYKNNIKEFLLQLYKFSPSYYNEFEKLYFELCKFQETELYEQPLLYIYLVDINDNENVISECLRLSLPKLIESEAYEQRTFELIIILNDESAPSSKDYESNNLKNKFKSLYYEKDIITIDINSGALNENKNNISDDIWSKYIHKIEEYSDGFEPIKRGKYITNTEVEVINEKFKSYIKDKFRPYLLDMINRIDKNISKNAGINTFFNKLKGNKQERDEYIQEYNIQKLNSKDKQRYVLSILLFHIRDYTDAYETLKKIRDSIKNKNKDYEAAIKQFLIICRYMKKEDKSKIENLEIFKLYKLNKDNILSLRSILLYLRMAEQLKISNIINHIYSFNLLLRDSANTNSIIGLIYEKVGYYLLFYEYPKIRKFLLNILAFATEHYKLEKDEDIKNHYLMHSLGYVCDLFKIDFDFSNYDDDKEIYNFPLIKKYIYENLSAVCEKTKNFNFAIPLYLNYLRFLIFYINDDILNYSQKKKIFDLSENQDKNIKEIENYFRLLNAIFTKGKFQYLDNFPLPIIEDDSLVFYIEHDKKILEENANINLDFVKSFKNYLELSIEQKYSVLSEDDISCLRYLDEQSSRTFISNYYMKTINNIKVNEKIYLKFNIFNPLNIKLELNNISLIINKKNIDNNKTDNENNFKYDVYSRDIPPKEKIELGMIVEFFSPGMYEISGLTMTLFKQIYVRYFFNKKNINTLYLNKDIFLNKGNNYTKKIKENFCFNVIDSNKSIDIKINQYNNKIILFQNQIKYLDIEINNKDNEVEIRKYTIFLEDDKNILLYPKYLHKNYLTPINQISIPIIGKKIGETKLKIIIKFEEKGTKSVLDLYREVITVKVYKGININIDDKIFEYNNSVNSRIIKLNMDIVQKMNINSITFNRNKSIVINKEKFNIESFNEDSNENDISNESNNIIKDKNISQKFVIKLLTNENKYKYNNDNIIDEIIGTNKRDDPNYPHLKEFFKEKFGNENNLILKYKLNIEGNNDNNFFSINCIYKHEIKIKNTPFMRTFYIDSLYLKNNLRELFTINYEAEDFGEEQKYITININLLNKKDNFKNLGNIIEYIEIKVDNADNNFDWIGLSSTKFKNIMNINDNENAKIFNCIIDEKSCSLTDKQNEINLNHFIFLVKIKNSNLIYKYTEFPNAIYYNKS